MFAIMSLSELYLESFCVLWTCKMDKIFLATFTTLSLCGIGYKLCTRQCECVDTKNSSFTEEQESRNLFPNSTAPNVSVQSGSEIPGQIGIHRYSEKETPLSRKSKLILLMLYLSFLHGIDDSCISETTQLIFLCL